MYLLLDLFCKDVGYFGVKVLVVDVVVYCCGLGFVLFLLLMI